MVDISEKMYLSGYVIKFKLRKNEFKYKTRRPLIPEIEAENAWLEGAHRDGNPYNKIKKPLEYKKWDETWLNCNKNC